MKTNLVEVYRIFPMGNHDSAYEFNTYMHGLTNSISQFKLKLIHYRRKSACLMNSIHTYCNVYLLKTGCMAKKLNIHQRQAQKEHCYLSWEGPQAMHAVTLGNTGSCTA